MRSGSQHTCAAFGDPDGGREGVVHQEVAAVMENYPSAPEVCHLHSPCCLCHLLSSPLRLASRTGWERSHPLASYSVDWGTRAGARAPAAALGRKESKRRASTWQQVIMPDLQRQSKASIMPVGLELATCHSSGQRGLLDAHRLLTATGSCVLKLTTENRRVEACPEPGE